jgi:Flp pilus assembly secretin CpaC
MKLNISVSGQASSARSRFVRRLSTFIVPALSKRSATVVVELKDGQTIASRAHQQPRSVTRSFLLGALPVIGALFWPGFHQ